MKDIKFRKNLSYQTFVSKLTVRRVAFTGYLIFTKYSSHLHRVVLLMTAISLKAEVFYRKRVCRIHLLPFQSDFSAISGRILENVGVVHGCILECDDFLQRLELRIRIEHTSELKADEFVIVTDTGTTAENG